MKKNHLTKTQRKNKNRRRKWTNAERLEKRWLNEMRNGTGSMNDNPLLRAKVKRLVNKHLQHLKAEVEARGLDQESTEHLTVTDTSPDSANV